MCSEEFIPHIVNGCHHVEHWADGGETKLSNLVLLCRHHHRAVHEGRWRLAITARGEVTAQPP